MRYKKIIITGATGFAGGRIAEYLLHKQPALEITATGRNEARRPFLERMGCDVRIGDLTDEVFVKSLFQKDSIVIHCAALSSPWGNWSDFENANIKATINLVREAEKFESPKFVFISTPSIYFNYKDRLNIKESDPLPIRMVNHYAHSKLIAENLVRTSKIENISLRPRALIGRGDTVIMPRILRAFESGRLKMIGNGKNIVDLTPVVNLAHAVYLALEAGPEISGEAFNITAGEPVLLWDTLEYMLSGLGYNFKPGKVPYWLAHSFAFTSEINSRWLRRKEPELTRYGIGILAKSMTLDIELAKSKLNYQPIQNTKEAIDEFIHWTKNKARS